jgi:membrane-associated phospholipid phosphatase
MAQRCVPTEDDPARRPDRPAAARRDDIAAWLACGVLLPLLVFALLASAAAHGTLVFDLPLLRFAQAGAGGRMEPLWLLVSRVGYEWGVVPADIVLVALLLLAGRSRGALFAGITLGGSGLLDMGAKLAFARVRPELWVGIAPEHNFSFPSGHAMGSMTLAWVLCFLACPTRWRRQVAVGMAVFVAAVGWSRIQLGVHYPSDIAAGWALATAWSVAAWLVLGRGASRSRAT